MPKPSWPWKGDKPADRSKRVALSAIDLMEALARGEVEAPSEAVANWHRHWEELGIY
jgi:hypothetical protein